jgi:hypothetical protein
VDVEQHSHDSCDAEQEDSECRWVCPRPPVLGRCPPCGAEARAGGRGTKVVKEQRSCERRAEYERGTSQP